MKSVHSCAHITTVTEADETADRIRSMLGMGKETDIERAGRRRMYEAIRYGKHCGQCGQAFTPGEPIWRDLRVSGFGPVCEPCHSKHRRFTPPEPCNHCERPVYQPANNRPRKHVFCCRACQISESAAKAKARRAAQRDTATCLDCGEVFEPQRRGVRYCSAACKQRAYRRRTVTECISPLVSGNDNRNDGGAA